MIHMTTQLDADPVREDEGPQGTALPGTNPAASHHEDLYTDARGGMWAGLTTGVCVGVVAMSNLMLLAAAFGQESGIEPNLNIVLWVLGTGLATGLVAGSIRLAKPRSGGSGGSGGGLDRHIKLAGLTGFAVAVGASFVGAVLFAIALLAARGMTLSWQPVVGLSLSVIAVTAFGGFYLASRRARIGLAASFVLTFLVLLSYMLTLDGLAAAANGGTAGAAGEEELAAAADALRDLLKGFRGSVGLIVAFYFGSDAAVSVVKILHARSDDAGGIARLDRDLAVRAPSPASGLLG